MGEPAIVDVSLPGGLTATRCESSDTATFKTPLLLCPGRMAGAWQWARLQPFLARRGYTSLAVNYRGHCGSAPSVDLATVGVADFVTDARVAAETLGCSVIAFGQSTGGLVVQKLAEAGVTSATVLCCSVPPAGILPSRAVTDRDLGSTGSGVVPPDRADFDEHVYNRMPSALADTAFSLQVPESGRVVDEVSNGRIAVDQDRVRSPVLSVVGGDDRQVPPEIGLAVAAKYGALSIVRPFSGHYALIYEPGSESTANMVVDWLDRIEL